MALAEPVPDDDDDLAPAWLSSSETLMMEDEDRNKRQAVRNRRLRGLLRSHRDSGAANVSAPATLTDVLAVGNIGDETDQPPPWYHPRDQSSVNLHLHEELLDFASFMKPTDEEVNARHAWVARIEEVAQSMWPSSKAHLFGSTTTGLCLPCADVDISVTKPTGIRATTAMKRLAEKLLEASEVSRVELIQSAKVPVLKLQQRSTGLWADVIVDRSDGLESSRFVQEQLRLFPSLAPLTLFLKLFLLQRGLHETFLGGMGSFLLVCTIISFLQSHPSARELRAHSSATLGNLLFDFFRYYGQEFRYHSVGISVLNGGYLFDRVARGWAVASRVGQASLCLESPVEPGVDLGSRCSKIGVVRASFTHAYHALGALFLRKDAPGHSLISPELLSAEHAVVANRREMLKAQPLPTLEAAGMESDECEDEEEACEGPAKRARLGESKLEATEPTRQQPLDCSGGDGAAEFTDAYRELMEMEPKSHVEEVEPPVSWDAYGALPLGEDEGEEVKSEEEDEVKDEDEGEKEAEQEADDEVKSESGIGEVEQEAEGGSDASGEDDAGDAVDGYAMPDEVVEEAEQTEQHNGDADDVVDVYYADVEDFLDGMDDANDAMGIDDVVDVEGIVVDVYAGADEEVLEG
eukprot:NODE_3381_length_2046_cov_3.501303.p1 GENE.NODE_3381_length_2046_cov_3.501303~~NODE_3381_length_2046_cov_3.501303.p1  ORF type:complete len:636 (+),score=231.68 NODE_3381_length_2046_cov_3.501303:95-2002(+)